MRTRKTVGIACPSQFPSASDMHSGISVLRREGYSVKLGPLLSAESRSPSIGFADGSAHDRKEDLVSLLDDKDVDIILIADGGTAVAEMLPLLPMEVPPLWRKKVVMGFSDATSILLFLHQQGVPCVYGPNLAEEGLARCLRFLRKRPRSFSLTGKGMWLTCGSAKGPALPVCVSSLRVVIGSEFVEPPAGSILFLEDGGVPTAGFVELLLHESLLHLFLSGWGDERAAGVVFGDIMTHGPYPEASTDLWTVLRRFASRINGPAWVGAPFGHTGFEFPIPFGIPTTLEVRDARSAMIRFDWKEFPPCF